MSCVERLRRILDEPLDYLHPQRLQLPAGFNHAEARHALNQILLERMDSPEASTSMPLTAVAQLWIRTWRQLPYIACLIGAWRLFPQLVRDKVLQQLPAPMRHFAGCRPGPRVCLPLERSCAVLHQVEAAGFNALVGLSGFIPPPLIQRLPLQFSPLVVDQHAQWPDAAADSTLFFLAVQHARLYPNPA